MREAERPEELADCALVIGDPEALGDDALQVEPPPTDHAVHGPVRACLDEFGDLGALPLREARRGTLGPVVQQAIGTLRVEPVHPVAQRLPVHAADPSRRRPVHAVQNRGQRQQPPALVRVVRRSRQAPELGRRIVRSQAHR
jgi:hypothetical protein